MFMRCNAFCVIGGMGEMLGKDLPFRYATF
jgi:hypothetical protein